MKRTLLALTFALSAAFVGCADGPLDYDCTVTWFDGDTEIESLELPTMRNIEDPAIAVEQCGEDQATHPDRPLEATKYECDCQSR